MSIFCIAVLQRRKWLILPGVDGILREPWELAQVEVGGVCEQSLETHHRHWSIGVSMVVHGGDREGYVELRVTWFNDEVAS